MITPIKLSSLIIPPKLPKQNALEWENFYVLNQRIKWCCSLLTVPNSNQELPIRTLTFRVKEELETTDGSAWPW